METVRLARAAMATRFEVILHGANADRLRAAGEEALAEVDRIEAQLSLYRPTSEVSRINALAASEPVRVSPAVFKLLHQAMQLSYESAGAFDITMGPLMQCWGFMHGTGHHPSEDEIAEARRKIGVDKIILDEEKQTVRFTRAGVMLDLGAIGKGYAVDQAAEVLRIAGVDSALLHGGTSTVYGLGDAPDQEPWMVAVDFPAEPAEAEWTATVSLRNEALSVSAIWGKFFEHDGKILGHVLDPRTGRPAHGSVLAAVVLPSATVTDALSTALLVEEDSGVNCFGRLHPKLRSLVIALDGTTFSERGITLKKRERIEKRPEKG